MPRILLQHDHQLICLQQLTMPVASATAEMPVSVLRRLKTYVRSTMKNDRLSSLGLMHILTEILKWTCTKPVGSPYGYFSPEIL
jgi:hypothetical protein